MIKYSNTWETKWYGPDHSELLVKVLDDTPGIETPVWIRYTTYEHAINGICEQCGEKTGDVQIAHRITAFTDDFKNYAAFCRRCRHEDNEYYKEHWNDYYSNIQAGLF